MSAFSYYKEEEYEDALATIDHFLHLNPGNKSAPYMYYLKALSYYDRISDVRRDQAITQEALNALNEVIRRYPDTEYGRDAKLKIDLVHDHLAGKEMEVGRFYLKRHNYIAAQNRFRKVIESYETTTHAPEALYRMVEVYLSLGLPAEAQKYAAVLGHNFPSNKWYHAAYRLINEGEAADEEPSWASRLLPTFGSDEVESEEDNGQSLIDRMTDNIGDLF
ncbi:MAG: outer membrane protein assembly factor BamD, partial [Rickettsiales bacterium]|nr:outer membrane protein assembly factor BamD [Rickettsiales bacterium]